MCVHRPLDLTLEGDEVVSFGRAHPLEGTVFYDQFKETGTALRCPLMLFNT